MTKNRTGIAAPALVCILLCSAFLSAARQVRTGAERMDAYLGMLKGRKVALVINQTSIVGSTLLPDTLVKRGVNIVKIFAPEHGFRGGADAGAHIDSGRDSATGLPVVSLYGDNKKPKKEQLEDVDVVVYDIQDVGVRFYTYISTLQYVMEACAEQQKMLLVLDRPNPNGSYVGGPVLDTGQRSFVGMQPVPVVYGMTAGEYARMLKGERWIKQSEAVYLKVISCEGYDHKQCDPALPVAPSPNLKSAASVVLYPSLCLFEGTAVSVGRGTYNPFTCYGAPQFKGKADYSFTPRSMTGATKPLYEGQECYGEDLGNGKPQPGFTVNYLVKAYNWYPDKAKFFNNFFEKLAGTKELRRQVMAGMTAQQIQDSWQKDIAAFKKIRKKYLLYKDFE